MEKLSELEENYGDGWIKLFRSFKNWEWFKDSKMVHLFIYFILSANHKDGNWRGIPVKRGQLVTGRKTITDETGLSEQSARTCIKRLKSTNELTIKSTNQYSIITICNYESYQSIIATANHQNNQPANQQLTSNQPATNQQLTTNKNVKNEKNIKNIKDIGGKIAFDEFWNLYDKKIDRPTCERKWDRLSFDDQEAIMEFIPSYKKSQPDKQYRKHPATFLNNRSWENEIIENGDGATFEQMSIEEHNRKILERYKVTL